MLLWYNSENCTDLCIVQFVHNFSFSIWKVCIRNIHCCEFVLTCDPWTEIYLVIPFLFGFHDFIFWMRHSIEMWSSTVSLHNLLPDTTYKISGSETFTRWLVHSPSLPQCCICVAPYMRSTVYARHHMRMVPYMHGAIYAWCHICGAVYAWRHIHGTVYTWCHIRMALYMWCRICMAPYTHGAIYMALCMHGAVYVAPYTHGAVYTWCHIRMVPYMHGGVYICGQV